MENPIDRIEELAREAGEIAEPRARAAALELAQAIMEFHRAAISRALGIIEDFGPAVLSRLVEDELTGALLLAHDLHPDSVETRVERAIVRLDEAFRSLGARVSSGGISEGVAFVNFESSRAWPGPQTRSSIEKCIQQAAPEIEAVVINGLRDETAQDFVPVSELLAGSQA